MSCSNFNNLNPPSYYSKIYISPQILIIILDRGKEFESNIKLNFSEDLNLMNYIELKQFGFTYKLIGVVTYIKESGPNGHFIAYCRSPINYQWFKYDDDIVTKVNNFQNEIIDYGIPYILFYNKISS